MTIDDAKIAPCLWFDGNAEEAINFYESVFPDTRIDRINRSPIDWPAGKAGDTITVEFTLLGSPYIALNGGPDTSFNMAISLQVYTEDQDETDRYWNAIVDNGGKENMCSWCSDKYGLHWQIVPRALMKAIAHPDPAAAKRAMEAMTQMVKIDIATIEKAVAGTA